MAEARVPRYLELPSMDRQGKTRYVLFHHFRGKSVHWDFRYEVDGHLIGWTILDNPRVPEAPKSVEEAKKLSETLDFNFRPVLGMEGKKCRVIEKAAQPKEWLFEKLNVGDAFEAEEGSVGATRFGPGYFVCMDKGFIWFGAQKVWYNEWFLESARKSEGKHSFYRLRVNARAMKQPLIDPETKRPLPRKFETVWNLWVPKKQEPYAISKRAEGEGWYPPRNFIALPKYWVDENKEEYEDWLSRAEEHWGRSRGVAKASGGYKLHQLSWMGQKVVRGFPVFHWYLSLDVGRVRLWKLRDNPLRESPTVATYIGPVDRKWFSFEGLLEPGEFLNPRKRLKAEWKALASGGADVDVSRVDGREILELDLEGELEGVWVLSQEERGAEIYVLEREEVEKAGGFFVLHEHSWETGSHFDVRVDVDLPYLLEWSLADDPRKMKVEESQLTVLGKCFDRSWLEVDGERKVGGILTRVKKLDGGAFELIEDSEFFKSFKFFGDSLEGYFVLRFDSKSGKWVFERSALPGAGVKKELRFEDKAGFIRVHLHDIREFSACEGAEEVKRYKVPQLPSGVEANVCIKPVKGEVHDALVQALIFRKPAWDLNRVRGFDFKPFADWKSKQVRGG